MADYGNPYMPLAQQIGRGLSGLFGPPDYAQKMKYQVGASEIGRNRAMGDKYEADTALAQQTHDNRAVFTPENVAAGIQALRDNPGLARLVAASLGQGGNANQAIEGLNAALGGQKILNATSEGDARTGYALTGHSAPVTAPLTQPGVAGLFAQQTSIANANNAAKLGAANVAAGASRYGADQRYRASRENNTDNINAGRWTNRGNPAKKADQATLDGLRARIQSGAVAPEKAAAWLVQKGRPDLAKAIYNPAYQVLDDEGGGQ